MRFNQCSNEHVVASATCRDFDFTLAFEDVVLTIIPACILLVFGSISIAYSYAAPRTVVKVGGILIIIKAALALGFVAIQAALLGKVNSSQDQLGPLAIPAQAVTLITSIVLIAVIGFHHFKDFAPSSVVIMYLLSTALFDAARIRTLYLGGYDASIYIASLALKCSLLLAELVEKRHILLPEFSKTPNESTSSMPSRALFLWLLPLIRRGYRNTLTLDDLKDLPAGFDVETLKHKLKKALYKADGKRRHLAYALALAFKSRLFSPIPVRALLVLAIYAQPLTIREIVTFIDSYQTDSPQPVYIGWALVAAVALLYLAVAVLWSLYYQEVYAFTIAFRGSTLALLHEKTLRLNHAEARGSNGLALNAVTVDIEKTADGLILLHEMWASLLGIGIGTYFLYLQIAEASFAPLAIVTLSVLITIRLGAQVGKTQQSWFKVSDERIKLIKMAITKIKSVKLASLQDGIVKSVQALRTTELAEMKKYMISVAKVAWVSQVTGTLAQFIAFVIYVVISLKREGSSFGSGRLFTSLAIIDLIDTSITTVGLNINFVIGAITSLERIGSFFDLAERNETQIVHKQASGEKQAESDSDSDTVTSGPLTPEKESHKDASASILSLKNASFKGSDAKTILSNISLDIPNKSFTIITGPTACGKSALLEALTGELELTAGLRVCYPYALSYCAQSQWIIDGTLRENITLGREYNEGMYNTIVRAACLDKDFDDMDSGDQTVIKSDGGSLSGGQKQRVTLARALYQFNEVYLLDDVFSALDATTSWRVFYALFGPAGLLKNKAVILVSSDKRHHIYADCILTLADGRLVENVQQEPAKDMTDTTPVDSAVVVKAKKDASKSIDAGDDAQGNSLLFFFRSTGRKAILQLALSYISVVAFFVGIQVLLEEWSSQNSTTIVQPGFYLGLYAALAIGFIGAYALTLFYGFRDFSTSGSKAMHEKLLASVTAKRMAFFIEKGSGHIIGRFSQDMFVVSFELPLRILNTFGSSLLLSASLMFTFVAVPYMAVTLPVLGAVYWLIQHIYLRTSRQVRALFLESNSPLYSVFSLTIDGLAIVRAGKLQEFLRDHTHRIIAQSQKAFHVQYSLQRWLQIVINLIAAAIAIIFTVTAILTRSNRSAGLVAIGLTNLISLSYSLNQLLQQLALMETALIATRRIQELIQKSDDVEKVDKKPSFDLGGIEFKNVTCRYGPELDPVLKDVSFSISSGTHLAICGRTGSGKSTIVMAISRLLEVESGQVLIDNQDISQFNVDDLCSSVIVIPQDSVILDGTVRQNLDPEMQFSDADIQRVLEMVHLTNLANSWEKGINEPLTDSTTLLSAGQIQLLGLARALLRKKRIVILDEATSNLDLEYEMLIRDVIQNELKDCTVVAIVHRLEWIRGFDKVLVMDQGKVSELDSPAVLLSDETSLFAKLAKSSGLEQK